MKCTNCKYCIQKDYGYANWSVEGTEIDCLLGLNPDFPEDRYYGEEQVLLYAEKCNKFTMGNSVEIGVDMESDELSDYSDDIEIKELLKKYEI